MKYLILFIVVASAGLIAHECGHVIATYAFGGQVIKIVLGPGIQLLPSFSMAQWNGTLGSVSYILPSESASAKGMRHWILFGGHRPEPLEGAMAMGLTPAAYFASIVSYSIGAYYLAIRAYSHRR